MFNKIALMTLCIIILASNAVFAANIMPMYCNASGATNEFNEGDSICVYGTGFEPGANVDIYIVKDNDTYLNQSNLEDVTGEIESVTTSDNGVLGLKKVWNSIVSGIYDLIIDINQNGLFDSGEPVNLGHGVGIKTTNYEQPKGDIQQIKPPEEVPEFSAMGALFIIILGATYIMRKRK